MSKRADNQFKKFNIYVSRYRTTMQEGEPIVVGSRGNIYPYGLNTIGLYVTASQRLFKTLIEQYGQPIQHGDYEIVFKLPASRLHEAAHTIKAHKRRVHLPSTRRKLEKVLGKARQNS